MLLVAMGMGQGADWPNYRGPDYNGFSQETDWKADWENEAPKILWTKSIGIGFSSITVADGRAYMMGNTGKSGEKANTDIVFCVDAVSGEELWRHEYPCELQPKYYEGGTLSSPTVDGDVVYTLSKMGDLFCFNAETGKIIWEKKMDYTLPTWHFSSSPLVWHDLLIFNLGSAGVALNKKDGALVWENGDGPCGYSTAVPYNMDGQDCVMIFGYQSIMGLTAKDGKKVWEYEWKTQHDVNAADPIIDGNKVFISSGYNRGCSVLEVNGSKATKVWESRVIRNHMNCTMLYEGFLYGFDESQLKCVDFKDGTEKWSEKSMGKGALMMSQDGRLIIMSDKSELVIAKATPEKFELISKTQLLPKGKCWTVPTLANGKIYARNAAGDVACIDVSP